MEVASTSKTTRREFVDRVRRARRMSKLTQSRLAKLLGVTPSAVSQWEHPDGTAPDLHHLRRFAAATGVSFEWLATGRGKHKHLGHLHNEDAVFKLDLFAQDAIEELLLNRFRSLSPRARETLSRFLEEVASGRRKAVCD